MKRDESSNFQSSSVSKDFVQTPSSGKVLEDRWKQNIQQSTNGLERGLIRSQEDHQARSYDDHHSAAEECAKQLTINLIFGPLFCAVVYALNKEFYCQLQPDPFDDNVTLHHRVLIYKINTIIFGSDVPALPPWTGSPRATFQVATILRASNAASISYQTLATIGNPCFFFYKSTSKRESAIERDQDQQRRLSASVAWYFDHSTELLPLTLHVALLLLSCAFFRFLWESDITFISFLVFVVSFGVTFHLLCKWTAPKRCPVYRTPCTTIIHHAIRHLLPALRSAPSPFPFIQTSLYVYALTKWWTYGRPCYPTDDTLLFVFFLLLVALLTYPYLFVQAMLPWTLALEYGRHVSISSLQTLRQKAIVLCLQGFASLVVAGFGSFANCLLEVCAISPMAKNALVHMWQRYTGIVPPDPNSSDPRSKNRDETCTCPIRKTFGPDELTSVIEAIFSSDEEVKIIPHPCVDHAQTFVQVIYQALETLELPPRIRKRCLKALCETCYRKAVLPISLLLPPCYDRQGFPLYSGGFGDVWKGKYNDQDVAIKVVRVPSPKELPRITGRFCKEVVAWKALRHPNVLPLLGVIMNGPHLAMVSEWMRNGNINEFVKKNPVADRLGLLVGVATGLIYIHSQGMIHGDLKGANILVDNTRHARVADFSLLTIPSDSLNGLSSGSHALGGTAGWMGPELIDPEPFGLKSIRRTKCSDSYALGMVIYETISGNLPFHKDAYLVVFRKVLGGKRPPRGVWFTDSLWELLEMCWKPAPDARPSVEDILQCLERVRDSPETPPGVDEGSEDDDDDDDDDDGDDG